jgi:5,10-methylenetetrahydrofolate reductase
VRQEGFGSLVVLGGDRTVGPARAVEHAWQLRQRIRRHVPDLALGGWANPHADADRQVGYLADAEFNAEFFLTQIVSHHDRAAIDRFQSALSRRQLGVPGMFGVFFYRSANAKTLSVLKQFLPVPVEELAKDFAEGASPEEVCARTITALRSAGIRHCYISNLPVARARQTLDDILTRVEP